LSKKRIRYAKTGKAKYISHLDLTATMQRAFLRAGIKLKYSEGFNPHPYMSVALPLSVGCESTCELMDVEMFDDLTPDALSGLLPEGLNILEAYIPERKFSLIKWIDIRCELHYDDSGDDPGQDMIIGKLSEHFDKTSIVIPKKSKSGISYIDIAPFIRNARFTGGEYIIMTARVSAQNPTISQNDIINLVSCDSKIIIPSHLKTKRIEIYDKDMLLFR